jgi:hypothetical protein
LARLGRRNWTGPSQLDAHALYRWRYDEFRDECEEERPCPLDLPSVKAHVLRRDVPVPPLHEVKDFFRFYVKQSGGRIKDRVTVRSTAIAAVNFFSGFTRVTETPFEA